jgi:hypothetical protein
MSEDLVIPVILSNVNWTKYIDTAQELLGYKPTRGVDASTSKLSEFAKFTASLAEFKLKTELNAKQTLRTPGPWLDHTFYGFLVESTASTILGIAESTDLALLSVQSNGKGMRAAIVSGTLKQWRDAVIVCCNATAMERVRRLFNQIKGMFDQIGLADVWFEFSHKSLPDKTFLLERQKT